MNLKNERKKVWGISFRFNKKKWVGPCGIYFMEFTNITDFPYDIFARRPTFFRTRKQAREEAKKHRSKNTQCKVERYILSWKKK